MGKLIKATVLSVAFLSALPASAEPPIFGSGQFGCGYKELMFSDYVKKSRNSVEICKSRGGYKLTIGKYNDPFSVQTLEFKDANVRISFNQMVLKGYHTYHLKLDPITGGKLTRVENGVESTLEEFNPESLHTLNNINKHMHDKALVKELMQNKRQ